jgi:hypothetical protein
MNLGRKPMHLKEYIDLPQEGWKVGFMPPYPPHLGLRFLEEPTKLFVSVSVETIPNPYCKELQYGLGGKPYLHVAFSKEDRSEVTEEEMQRFSKAVLRGRALIPYEIPQWIRDAAKAKFEQETGTKVEGGFKTNTKHCCCLIPAEVA